MATFFSDLGRFMLAVVTRWQAYITGSLFTAAVFLYEHVTGKMISATVVLWGSAVFFVTGAFLAWREQYRSHRAIEIRDRLDALVQRGQALYDKWENKKKPRLRTNQWISRADSFVRRHFDMEAYDAYKLDAFGGRDFAAAAGKRIGLAMRLGDNMSEAFALAISTRIEALGNLRTKIRD